MTTDCNCKNVTINVCGCCGQGNSDGSEIGGTPGISSQFVNTSKKLNLPLTLDTDFVAPTNCAVFVQLELRNTGFVDFLIDGEVVNQVQNDSPSYLFFPIQFNLREGQIFRVNVGRAPVSIYFYKIFELD